MAPAHTQSRLKRAGRSALVFRCGRRVAIRIAFVRSDAGRAATWAIRPDGRGMREVVRGWAPAWSADGRWLYYWRLGVEPGALERVPIDGGAAETVREGAGINIQRCRRTARCS